MARRLRCIPEGGALVEVTCRTMQGRFLLKPSDELKSIIIGVLVETGDTIRIPTSRGIGDGLASSVPLQTTRTGLCRQMVICPGPTAPRIGRRHAGRLNPQALKDRSATSPERLNPRAATPPAWAATTGRGCGEGLLRGLLRLGFGSRPGRSRPACRSLLGARCCRR